MIKDQKELAALYDEVDLMLVLARAPFATFNVLPVQLMSATP